MFNDLINLTVGSLAFDLGDRVGDVEAHLYGNTLGISGIENQFNYECQVYIHCGLKLATPATFITGEDGLFGAELSNEDTALHLIGPIDLNGHGLTLTANAIHGSEGRVYVEGGISGTGNVTVYTAYTEIIGNFDVRGIVEFKGTGNDFSGKLTLSPTLGSEILFDVSTGVVVNDLLIVNNAGAVKLARANQIGDAATVRLLDGATLQLNGHDDTILNLELISDRNGFRPSVMDTGGGTLTLRGNLKSTNNTATVTPTVKGKLYLPGGSHTFDISGTAYAGLEVQAQISGGGGFSKSGDAALLLKGDNSFDGGVNALSGTIDVYHANGFGSTARGVTLSGGSVTLRNLSVNGETLFVRGTRQITPETGGSLLVSFGVSAWRGAIELDTNLVVSLGDIILSGSISGPGGLALHSGGTVQIGDTNANANANTYTGTTLVRCSRLELNKPFGVHAYSGPLVVGDDVGGPYEVRWLNSYQNPNTPLTLYGRGLVNLNEQVENFGPVTFNGGTVETGMGFFMVQDPIIVNPSAFTATINGNLSLSVSPAYFVVSNGVADPDLRINSVILGASIIKQGQGTLTLAGANAHVGSTVVAEGILQADSNEAFGSLSGKTTVADGAAIRLGDGVLISEQIELSGAGVGGSNSVLQAIGHSTVTGSIVLNGPSTIHVAQNTRLAIDSIISGTGPLTKTGLGHLYLGGISGGVGNNSFSGGTFVASGSLHLSKNPNVHSVPGLLVVGPATAVSPAIARFSRTGTMPPAGNVTVNAHSLLDLNGNNQLLSQLNLNDGGSVQTGGGTLSFTGGGSVNVGTLNPGLSGLRASASISGRVAAADEDYLVFNVSGYGLVPLTPDPEMVVSAEIAGRLSSIAKNGEGTMLLSGNNTFAGSSSTVTEFNINAGAVIAASPTALGGADNWVYVINGASLALVDNIAINKQLYLNSTNPAALDNRGGHNAWAGPISLSRDSGISVNIDWSLTVQGVVSGVGSLTGLRKNGAGMLRLTGNNTYAGTTTLSDGALWVDGSQPQSPVQIRGARLQGNGTVGHVSFTGSPTGVIAPGASPGILTCGNFNANAIGGGTLTVELNGISPGTGHDQVNVRGAVNLTGLRLSGSLDFNPTVGHQFTIINNDGTDAVNGTFIGLQQSAAFILSGALFQISYTGGTGNDVVLTYVSSVPQITVTTLPATEVPNYAVDFDGSDDRVQAATNSFPTITNSFTIELWANPTGFRTETAEVNTGISDINQRFAVFPDHGDGYGVNHVCAGLSVGINGISVYEHAVNYLPSLLVYSNSISGWTHVALVYNNGRPRLYVNGALAHTGLRSTRTFVHPSANLGGSIHALGYGPYQGQLDEVRIWDTALSQTQIQTNLNRSLTGAESALVAYYRCNEKSGTSLADSAPAPPNNSGVLNSGAAFVLSGALPSDTINGPTVTLNGLANPQGVAGAVWFEWGATTNYGNVTAAKAIAGGSRNVSFFQQLTELAAGSYHFRAAGSNSFNVSFGLDQSFTLLHGTPALRIETLADGQVRLLWPTNGPLFRLQSSTNLNPAAWFVVQPPGTVVGANHVVTKATSSRTQFYRLIHP
jgi:autotransporter-associated beta strand protein